MAGWKYDNLGTDDFFKWIMFGLRNQPDRGTVNKEAQEAFKQSLEEYRKGGDEGTFNASREYNPFGKDYKPGNFSKDGGMLLPQNAPGQRMTAMGRDAMAKLGPGAVEALQARSDQAAALKQRESVLKQIEIGKNNMERIAYGVERGELILASANKTLKQFNGDKSRIGPLYNVQIEAANTFFTKVGFNPGITALDDAATQKEKIEKAALKAVNDRWVDFNQIPNDNPMKAIKAGELQQLLSTHIDRFGTSKEAYEPIQKGLTGWQEQAVKPQEKWSEPYAGPGGSRLQKNLTTNKEQSVLGRVGEGRNPADEDLKREQKYDLIVARKLKNYFGTTPQIDQLSGSTMYPINPETGKPATPQEYQAKASEFYNEVSRGKATSQRESPKIPGGYKSAEDVKLAYQSGKLSKAAASSLLRKYFGMQ